MEFLEFRMEYLESLEFRPHKAAQGRTGPQEVQCVVV
jgi:hypothetical protein